MTYLLDTNVAIALIKGQPKDVRERLQSAIQSGIRVAVSTITVHELWFGVAKSAKQDENARRLKAFLSGDVTVLDFNSDAAAISGAIRATLKRRGTPIGPYDLLIAGQAISANATLVTANTAEFMRVDGLTLVDWTV